jgi:hypothetical protein
MYGGSLKKSRQDNAVSRQTLQQEMVRVLLQNATAFSDLVILPSDQSGE